MTRRKGLTTDDAHGIILTGKTVPLGRGRSIVVKPEMLDPWYYDGQWGECGLRRDDLPMFAYYKIMVKGRC